MADGKSTDYSKVMIIPLTEGTGCDFCFARPPSEMVDPRALPCGHSHCTKCLEVNYQYKEIECKTCRSSYRDIDILSLPRTPQSYIDNAVETKPEGLPCDLCREDENDAVVCCTGCKKRLCHKHAQEHLQHVDNHEMGPIQFALTPERYEVKRCDIHSAHALTEVCEHCKKLFCNRCDARENCSEAAKYGDPHKVVPLRKITNKLRAELERMNNMIYEKMKRCRDIEKTAWKHLSNLEYKSETIHMEIDNITAQLIAEIKRQGEEKKREFSKHLEKTSEEVQDFSEKMLVGVTCLDDLFMSGSRLADRGHDVEVLTQFYEMSTQLMQAEKDLSYEKPYMVKQSYMDKGTAAVVDIGAQMTLAPTQLTYAQCEKLSEGDNGSLGVSFTENSRILVCDETGLYEYSSELEDKQPIKLPDGLMAMLATQVGETLVVKAAQSAVIRHVETYIGTKEDPTGLEVLDVMK